MKASAKGFEAAALHQEPVKQKYFSRQSLGMAADERNAWALFCMCSIPDEKKIDKMFNF